MKKNDPEIKALVLTFAVLFLLTGCQKLIDYIHKPGNGDAVSNICQVQTITSDGPYGANYVFNYNKRGSLESIITNALNDGNTNVFFIYDNKHRASRVLYSFTPTATTPGLLWAWEKFDYNKANQIIRDTSYGVTYIGPDGEPLPSTQYMTVTRLKYDGYNRVVAGDDSVWSFGNFSNTDHYAYKYDSHGNLEYTARQYHSTQFGGTTYNDTFRVKAYDDKISMRRTDQMWMFIDRNYSVNNAFTNASYNYYGLPLLFDSKEYLQGLVTLIPFIDGNVTVQYLCDGKGNNK